MQQLELLNGSKSPGPDDIHPKLLKRFQVILSFHYYRFSLEVSNPAFYPEIGKMQILSQFIRETLNYLLRIIGLSHSHQ